MTESGDVWRIVGIFAPLIWGAALAATVALIVLLMPFFQRVALAVPNGRSSHTTPTPQGGGIAVVAAAIGVSAVAIWTSTQFGADVYASMVLVVGAALLLALVGIVDDMRELGAVPKLLAQIIAVLLVIAALPDGLRIIPYVPEWVERAVLLGAGLWLVNLVNFMDGIDWMMVAEAVPITAGVALIGALGTLPAEALVVALALNGAMLGFAPFNKPVARLFLGDMGSLPIGLLLVWLLFLVAGSGHLAAALLLPLYFLGDATITLLRRLIGGERVWEAHRTHFYQRARARGLSNMEIVGRVFAVNCGLVALAAMSVVMASPVASVISLGLGAALVAWLIAGLARGKP